MKRKTQRTQYDIYACVYQGQTYCLHVKDEEELRAELALGVVLLSPKLQDRDECLPYAQAYREAQQRNEAEI